MPPPYELHVFICTNARPPGHPKGSCHEKGSEAVRERFKEELHNRGLKGRMRANAAGCLDMCSLGTAVVVYPQGIWYGNVTADDVVPIIEEHLIGGRPVERLLMPFMTKKPLPTKLVEARDGGAQNTAGTVSPPKSSSEE